MAIQYSRLTVAPRERALGDALQVRGPMTENAVALRRAQIEALISGAADEQLPRMESAIVAAVPMTDLKQAETRLGNELRQWALKLVYERMCDPHDEESRFPQKVEAVVKSLHTPRASAATAAEGPAAVEQLSVLYSMLTPEERTRELQRIRDAMGGSVVEPANLAPAVEAGGKQFEALFRSMSRQERLEVVRSLAAPFSRNAPASELERSMAIRRLEVRALFSALPVAQQLECALQMLDDGCLPPPGGVGYEEAIMERNAILTPMARSLRPQVRAAVLHELRSLDRMQNHMSRYGGTLAISSWKEKLFHFARGCDATVISDLRRYAVESPPSTVTTSVQWEAASHLRFASMTAWWRLNESDEAVKKLIWELLGIRALAQGGSPTAAKEAAINAEFAASFLKTRSATQEMCLQAMTDPVDLAGLDDGFRLKAMGLRAAQWPSLMQQMSSAQRDTALQGMQAKRGALLAEGMPSDHFSIRLLDVAIEALQGRPWNGALGASTPASMPPTSSVTMMYMVPGYYGTSRHEPVPPLMPFPMPYSSSMASSISSSSSGGSGGPAGLWTPPVHGPSASSSSSSSSNMSTSPAPAHAQQKPEQATGKAEKSNESDESDEDGE